MIDMDNRETATKLDNYEQRIAYAARNRDRWDREMASSLRSAIAILANNDGERTKALRALAQDRRLANREKQIKAKRKIIRGYFIETLPSFDGKLVGPTGSYAQLVSAYDSPRLDKVKVNQSENMIAELICKLADGGPLVLSEPIREELEAIKANMASARTVKTVAQTARTKDGK